MEPPIQFAPQPKVTPLDGSEAELDDHQRVAACRLLEHITSIEYVGRARLAFGEIVRAFDHWPDAGARCTEELAREWAHNLHAREQWFRDGMVWLADGKREHAAAVLLAAVRDIEPDDPRNERHISIAWIARELGPGLVATAEIVSEMFARIETTLNATWSRELMVEVLSTLEPDARDATALSDSDAIPPWKVRTVRTGAEVPITGFWIPATVRSACPNLLLAGTPAPEMVRASVRYDHPPWPEVAGTEDDWRSAGWTEFEFVTEPTVWRMLR